MTLCSGLYKFWKSMLYLSLQMLRTMSGTNKFIDFLLVPWILDPVSCHQSQIGKKSRGNELAQVSPLQNQTLENWYDAATHEEMQKQRESLWDNPSWPDGLLSTHDLWRLAKEKVYVSTAPRFSICRTEVGIINRLCWKKSFQDPCPGPLIIKNRDYWRRIGSEFP